MCRFLMRVGLAILVAFFLLCQSLPVWVVAVAGRRGAFPAEFSLEIRAAFLPALSRSAEMLRTRPTLAALAARAVGRNGGPLPHASSPTARRAAIPLPNNRHTLTHRTHTALRRNKTIASAPPTVGRTIASAVSTLGPTIASAVSTLGPTIASAVSTVGRTIASAPPTVGPTIASAVSTVGRSLVYGGPSVLAGRGCLLGTHLHFLGGKAPHGLTRLGAALCPAAQQRGKVTWKEKPTRKKCRELSDDDQPNISFGKQLKDPSQDYLLQSKVDPLNSMFQPKSVAVVGATERPGAVGRSELN
eukprot:GHVT01096111.1.p1 GENE.GHVT01096111.1~~GHVT01096111.1.p1  ORF type:complete len:302 (-),score=55.70 GHVT01096111.1:271-1176(-)